MSHVERALGAGGSALRRRERRLRSFWRHEQMAIQMVLATVTHHSFGKVGTARAALRGQKQGTRTVQGEEHELHHTAKFRTTPLPSGGRPAPLSEVAGWQVKVARHTEQLIDDLPYVQILDAPVPQMVDSAMDFFRRLDLPVAEQVIDAPMISSSSSCPSRAALSEPLMVEQLVEVPTTVSYSSLHRSGVDIPVPGGGGPSCGLHGFPPRQRSTASPSSTERISKRIVEQIVDHSSEERSSQRIVEQLVDISSGGLSPGVFSASSTGAAVDALLVVAVVWARHVLLVKLHLVFCLLAARQFSAITASSSLSLTASGSPKDMASPS